MLTPSQVATFRNDLTTNPEVSAWVAARNDDAIADYYNAASSPAFLVWRKQINTSEIGPVLNWVAVSNLTTANRDRATTFVVLNPNTFDATADIASYWDTTFGGALGGEGANTRAALSALWKRSVSRLERLFVTGTGTDATPGTTPFTSAPSVTGSYVRAVLDGSV